jgi:hypothetical protein
MVEAVPFLTYFKILSLKALIFGSPVCLAGAFPLHFPNTCSIDQPKTYTSLACSEFYSDPFSCARNAGLFIFQRVVQTGWKSVLYRKIRFTLMYIPVFEAAENLSNNFGAR